MPTLHESATTLSDMASFSSLALLSSFVSTANLMCLPATTFSNLSFLFNSFSSPRFHLLRVVRYCFSGLLISFFVDKPTYIPTHRHILEKCYTGRASSFLIFLACTLRGWRFQFCHSLSTFVSADNLRCWLSDRCSSIAALSSCFDQTA